jgi:hypothetical protein
LSSLASSSARSFCFCCSISDCSMPTKSMREMTHVCRQHQCTSQLKNERGHHATGRLTANMVKSIVVGVKQNSQTAPPWKKR